MVVDMFSSSHQRRWCVRIKNVDVFGLKSLGRRAKKEEKKEGRRKILESPLVAFGYGRTGNRRYREPQAQLKASLVNNYTLSQTIGRKICVAVSALDFQTDAID